MATSSEFRTEKKTDQNKKKVFSPKNDCKVLNTSKSFIKISSFSTLCDSNYTIEKGKLLLNLDKVTDKMKKNFPDFFKNTIDSNNNNINSERGYDCTSMNKIKNNKFFK